MGMKLVLDLDACQGYANCLIESPGLFDLDDHTDKAVLLDEAPSEDRRAEAEAAVRGCPARAISIEGA
ncbi:ferredoxin [Streptomonospora algeriensis]|uniref:Ferredoxin n=1 Tax=Streptomonospora algeriensis TaxID=995084 RepID=A0ABW3BDL7_9ACTN